MRALQQRHELALLVRARLLEHALQIGPPVENFIPPLSAASRRLCPLASEAAMRASAGVRSNSPRKKVGRRASPPVTTSLITTGTSPPEKISCAARFSGTTWMTSAGPSSRRATAIARMASTAHYGRVRRSAGDRWFWRAVAGAGRMRHRGESRTSRDRGRQPPAPPSCTNVPAKNGVGLYRWNADISERRLRDSRDERRIRPGARGSRRRRQRPDRHVRSGGARRA